MLLYCVRLEPRSRQRQPPAYVNVAKEQTHDLLAFGRQCMSDAAKVHIARDRHAFESHSIVSE